MNNMDICKYYKGYTMQINLAPIITFTMTAQPRVNILKRTLESFSNNLTDCNLKNHLLILNVDCNQPDNPQVQDRLDVMELCESYFREVKWNFGDCYFSRAVKYVFSNVQSEYIFHLEDDWELLEKQSLYKMYELSQNYKQVALRAYNDTHKPARFQLAPSLIKKDYIAPALERFKKRRNPEETIREYLKETNGTSMVYTTPHVILKDIGREWLAQNNLIHGGSKKEFVCYRKGNAPMRNQNTEIGR